MQNKCVLGYLMVTWCLKMSTYFKMNIKTFFFFQSNLMLSTPKLYSTGTDKVKSVTNLFLPSSLGVLLM